MNMETENSTQEMTAPEGVLSASNREGAPTLLIKPQDGRYVIIPWINLLYGDYKDLEDSERITLFYSSHDICIEGVHLESLFERLAKFGVEWVKENDKGALARCPQGLPFIERISVSEKSKI